MPQATPNVYFTPTMAKLVLEQIEASGVTSEQTSIVLERQEARIDRRLDYGKGSYRADFQYFSVETPLYTMLKKLETPFNSSISLFKTLKAVGVIQEEPWQVEALVKTAFQVVEPQYKQALKAAEGDWKLTLGELKLPEAEVYSLDLEKLRDLAQPRVTFVDKIKSRA